MTESSTYPPGPFAPAPSEPPAEPDGAQKRTPRPLRIVLGALLFVLGVVVGIVAMLPGRTALSDDLAAVEQERDEAEAQLADAEEELAAAESQLADTEACREAVGEAVVLLGRFEELQAHWDEFMDLMMVSDPNATVTTPEEDAALFDVMGDFIDLEGAAQPVTEELASCEP